MPLFIAHLSLCLTGAVIAWHPAAASLPDHCDLLNSNVAFPQWDPPRRCHPRFTKVPAPSVEMPLALDGGGIVIFRATRRDARSRENERRSLPARGGADDELLGEALLQLAESMEGPQAVRHHRRPGDHRDGGGQRRRRHHHLRRHRRQVRLQPPVVPHTPRARSRSSSRK